MFTRHSRIFSFMKKIFLRFLDVVERLGNRLPDPTTLFLIAAAVVVLASWILSAANTTVVHPGTKETISVVNLLSADGLRRMVTDAVKNFTDFPPLGLVLVTMIGISVAERSGLITAALRVTVLSVPRWLVTSAVVFAGVNSSLAADAGYIVLIPLGAAIFHAVGRHPLAGLSAAFAGVAGGFSANLSITSLDPLLAGITDTGARLIDPSFAMNVAGNWYFMIVSTFLLTAIGSVVCEKIVEPRLGEWKSTVLTGPDEMQRHISHTEKRALLLSLLSFIIGIGVVALVSVPDGALLRDAAGTLKPLEKSIVPILMLLFLVSGIVYAVATKTARSDKDIATMASDGLGTLGSYIVLSFVMAQFISYFAWSNMGVVVAVRGAEFLQGLHLDGPILMAAFVIVAAVINLLIASASAKWTVMAPVFVPMFMLLGIHPAATQLAFRIGDSSTNMIAPLLSYIPLILVAMQRYTKSASLGTMLSLMIPYSISFIIVWTLFMLAWIYLGIPLGPDTQVAIPIP